MIRTFFDHKKQAHTLDLDAVLVDGVWCRSVQATAQDVQFELQTGDLVTCELAQFWHDIAGPDLSAQEAGLLLADCLVRQVVLQRMSASFHEATSLLARVTALPTEIPSFHWLTTRLDPLAAKAMGAYDGTSEMTDMLARILQQEPTTIRAWALQLGLPASKAPTSSEGISADGTETQTLMPSMDFQPETQKEWLAEQKAGQEDKSKRFHWTAERLEQLEQALKEDQEGTVYARARRIARRFSWPERAVSYKIYDQTLRRQNAQHKQAAPREPEGNADAREDDRRADPHLVAVS